MLGQLLAPEIEEYLERRDFVGLREALSRLETPEVADLVGSLTHDRQALVFRILPRAMATETFEYLEPEPQKELVERLAKEQVTAILNDMSPDEVDFLFGTKWSPQSAAMGYGNKDAFGAVLSFCAAVSSSRRLLRPVATFSC